MTKTFSILTILVLLLLGGTPAGAVIYTADDLLTVVDTETVNGGDMVTVTGSGFEPGTEVMIFLEVDEEETELLGEDDQPVVADANGDIEVEITIPEEFAGTGNLLARGMAPDGAEVELVANIEEGEVTDLLAVETSSNSGWFVGGGIASAAAVLAAFVGRRMLRA